MIQIANALVTRMTRAGKSASNARGSIKLGLHYDRPVKASTVGNTVYVCNYFWNEQTTDNVYNTYKDLDKKYIVLKGLQGTYTRSFIHELFHAELVTEDRPHPVDMIYQGKRAYGAEVISEWVLEYKAKPEDVLKNADSFAIFVIGTWISHSISDL